MCKAVHSESGSTLSIQGCPDYLELQREVLLLRQVVAPILRHADGSDLSPPLKFSIMNTRKARDSLKPKIRGAVNE